MVNEWPIVTLSELSVKITKGTTPTKKEGGFSSCGVNFIKAECVTLDGKIDESKFSYISLAIHEKYRRSHLAKDDILFSMAGIILGKTALVKQQHLPANTNQALALIRPISHKVFPGYLHYFLQQSSVFHYVNNSTSQSAQPNINLREIGNLDITLPPLPEQKAIAHVLGSLDDKVELNRQINETLEGLAQALFKSWFVDFDPVIDNAIIAGNPIPKKLTERAVIRREALANGTANRITAKSFPDSFQFAEEMGWIPKGWETQALYDMAKFINGAAYKGKDFSCIPEALPVIKIAEIKNGITGQTKFTDIDKGDKYRIDNGDILLSWSGNPDTSIDTFIWTNDEGYLNQHIFKVSLLREVDRYFVYYQLKHLRSNFADIARDKQTTGLGHFTARDMKRLRVFKPTSEFLDFFNESVASLYKRNFENRISTKNLTKLRNTLLPKLISGGVRIPYSGKVDREVIDEQGTNEARKPNSH